LQAIWRAAAANADSDKPRLSPHDRFALNRRQAGLLRPAGRINSHPVRSAAVVGAHLPAIGGGSVYASMADPLPSRASSLPQGLFRREGICRSRRTSPLLPKACRARLLLPKSHHRIPASAEGVGALLAGDLARSGSKSGRLGGSDQPRPQPHDRFAANRRQTERRPAGLLRPPGSINSHRVRSAAFAGARTPASGSRHKKRRPS
jgi:hypothetical protein